MSESGSLHGRRRRFLVLNAGLFLVVLVVVVGTVLLGPRLRSPAQVAADAAPPSPSMVTAVAERRALVEPVVLRGRLRPGKSVKVLPPAAALGPNSVVTKVLVDPGDRLVEGGVVLERAGAPMIALELPFPLYRDIESGATGPDVAEVQRALRRLGYRVTVSAKFDTATQQQVKRFFKARGYGPQLSEIDEPEPEATGDAEGEEPPAKSSAGPRAVSRIPQSSILAVSGANKRISKVRVRVGHVLTAADEPMLELDSKPSTIMAIVDAADVGSLSPGQKTTVTDDLTGEEAAATLRAVGSDPVTGADGSNGFEAEFRFTGEPIGGGVDRALRLDVQMASGADEVLAVPVSAVYSRPDGSTFVTIVSAGGDPVDLTVTTGQIAGGWVEIQDSQDSALADGIPVVVGEQANG